VPVGMWLLRSTPEERGLRPLGASGPKQTAADIVAAQKAGRVSVTEAAHTLPFWLLMGSFFVCGYTSNGMVLTHFMPHALEHNFTAMQASTALGVMGAMNMIGTLGSGWLCDRLGRRGPLAIYYFVRGLSLIFLLYVWDVPSLHLWAALFGLNYISTVPPTTTLTANIYGRFSVGELSGWIFFAHQVGSALGAAGAGWIFEWTGGGHGLPRGRHGDDDPRGARAHPTARAGARDDVGNGGPRNGPQPPTFGAPRHSRVAPLNPSILRQLLAPTSARSRASRGADRRRSSARRPPRCARRRRRPRATPTPATR